MIGHQIGTKYRTDVILSTSFGWVVGYLLLPLAAYLLGDYVYLQLLPTLTMTLMIVLWLPHLPESPRWLLTKRQYSTAKRVLQRACKHNGRLQDFEAKFQSLQVISAERNETTNLNCKPDQSTSNLWSLLTSRKYCTVAPILWLSFFVNGFIYHGFSLNIEIIGGSFLVNFALAGLIEIPSMLSNLVGMRYMTRKSFTVLTILGAGLAYALMVALRLAGSMPADSALLRALAILGKMFIFSTYNAVYIHAAEIFPTELRHTGVSSCSIAARFGSTMAPFVKEIVSRLPQVKILDSNPT